MLCGCVGRALWRPQLPSHTQKTMNSARSGREVSVAEALLAMRRGASATIASQSDDDGHSMDDSPGPTMASATPPGPPSPPHTPSASEQRSCGAREAPWAPARHVQRHGPAPAASPSGVLHTTYTVFKGRLPCSVFAVPVCYLQTFQIAMCGTIASCNSVQTPAAAVLAHAANLRDHYVGLIIRWWASLSHRDQLDFATMYPPSLLDA